MAELTRRRFMQATGALGAGAVLAPYVRISPAGADDTDAPPTRVVLVVLDDARYDDLYYLSTVQALMANGTVFDSHRTDTPACAEARASIFTGFQRSNHGMSVADVDSYYEDAVLGTKVDSTWWRGPWEKLITTPRQAGDNPAQSTGQINNWLKAALPDVKVGVVGKYQNNYAHPVQLLKHNYKVMDATGIPLCARRVPPDVDYWAVKVGDNTCKVGRAANWDGGNQDSYHNWINYFVTDGSNIGTNTDGNGQLIYTNYEKQITSMTWSNGDVVCVLSEPHEMVVGDLFCVAKCIGAKNTTWNSPPAKFGVPAVEWAVTAVDDDYTFHFSLAKNPGLLKKLGFVYPKKLYAANLMTTAALDFFDSCADTDSFYLYFALDSCHQGKSDVVETEKKYVGAVNPLWFMLRDGVPGSYASTISPTASRFTKARVEWAQRQEDLQTVNDNLQTVIDYLDERGWTDNITWIITSDQGVHHGEHGLYVDARGHYFVKQTALEPSARAPLVINGPAFAAAEVTRPTDHFDLPFTVLDLFGLTDHPVHDLRDGVSLMRLLDPTLYPDRAIALTHQLPDLPPVPALVEADNVKFIEAQPNAVQPSQQVAQLYDLTNDPDETTNLAAAQPDRVAEMRARASVLLATRGSDYRENEPSS